MYSLLDLFRFLTEKKHPLLASPYVSFRYTKHDCDVILGFLKANNWNTSKTFSCVWDDHFQDRPRHEAPLVLDLIERVLNDIKLENADPPVIKDP